MAGNTDSRSLLVRHEFLIRRLHSLSGLLPVGVFLLFHLLTNASVLESARMFQGHVDQIHSLGSILPLVEWVGIFLPLLFHAAVGVVIAAGALPNTGNYPYPGNVRYMLQRATAWIALVFILAHVFHMHGWFKPLAGQMGGAQFRHLFATTSTAQALQASVLIQIFYAVGILATVYHFANGLWTMGITWGVWLTPAAQRRASYACLGFGLLLGMVGMGALVGMVTVDVSQSLQAEDQINKVKLQSGEISEEEFSEQRDFVAAEQSPESGTPTDTEDEQAHLGQDAERSKPDKL